VNEQDDWGDMDEVSEEAAVPPSWEEARSAGGADDVRLTDIGLEEGAVNWPGPGAEPAGSPLAKVREELVQQSGVARRLDRSLAMRAEANQVAKDFVEDTDPGRYVPGARGRFEAMVVPNDDLDSWSVVVRFVPEGPAAAFLDAVEWFEGWLAPVVRRPLKAGTYWCGQWQEHAEAMERLKALWEAWEAARAEGGNAMSYWWTVHFDAHWAALADSAGGPFSACARRGQHSTDLRALPSDFDGAEE
jgi:Domain of unknown function (DUF4913)